MKTREEKLAWRKNYRLTHKAERRIYLDRNKEKIRQQQKIWKLNNVEKIKKYREKYAKKNHPDRKPRVAKTREENLEKRRTYYRERTLNDRNFRATRNFCNLIYISIKFDKAGRAWEKILGYTRQDLIDHLTTKFRDGMSWENYGKIWHVDHIIPRTYFDFTKREQVKSCWELKNVQPLFAYENMSKSDKMPNGNKLRHSLS